MRPAHFVHSASVRPGTVLHTLYVCRVGWVGWDRHSERGIPWRVHNATPHIGVSKTPRHRNDVFEVVRGLSWEPVDNFKVHSENRIPCNSWYCMGCKLRTPCSHPDSGRRHPHSMQYNLTRNSQQQESSTTCLQQSKVCCFSRHTGFAAGMRRDGTSGLHTTVTFAR